jgi:hypothetical protein
VKLCVRPTHLLAGTPLDNTADMLARGRAPYSRLDGYKAAMIWARHLCGGVTQKQLADEYGVSKVMVHYIVKERWWREPTLLGVLQKRVAMKELAAAGNSEAQKILAEWQREDADE